jgi:REase_DpnII-MboI
MIEDNQLRVLEDEQFFSVLDVALDIQAKLNFGENPSYIQLIRTVVRYRILLPIDTIGMRDRYCDLRMNAAQFLQRQGYLSEAEWTDTFDHRWKSLIKIEVANENEFRSFLSQLEKEENHRSGETTFQVRSGAISKVEHLCDRFHRVALRLRNRHAQRPGFEIKDEYDVQDLLHGGWPTLKNSNFN